MKALRTQRTGRLPRGRQHRAVDVGGRNRVLVCVVDTGFPGHQEACAELDGFRTERQQRKRRMRFLQNILPQTAPPVVSLKGPIMLAYRSLSP